jgi:phosphatidate cytidylyltransferase
LVLIQQYGPWWLVGAILMVAIADIAAYFFGRAFGKRKLAPSISPGKTWEGVWGAMVTVTLICVLAAAFSGHSHNTLLLLSLILGVPLLTLLSIAGDLLESMLKRQAGLKDSSNLLPGHGGVMDRIDSHTAALPLIALVLLLQRGTGG